MRALVHAVHDALNATALRRTPDPDLLPPRVPAPVTRALPAPAPLGAGLLATLQGRRSRYVFGERPPPLPDLAALLHHGLGTAPRAGGLPSVVASLVVRPGGELGPGVHRADLRLPLPGLAAVRTGDPTPYLAASLDQPPFATRVPLWIALGIDLGATLGRYPARHYRTLHLDAGAALQNLLLVGTALGLTTCPVMGYDDRAWARLLDLPDDILVAGLVAVG